MSEVFFNSPILNSPYEEPRYHWELDGHGQPTGVVKSDRRLSALISPIPKTIKVRGKGVQGGLLTDELSSEYNPAKIINGIRWEVKKWRKFPEKKLGSDSDHRESVAPLALA